MLNSKKIIFLFSFCLICAGNYAQQMNYSNEEPTDFMRSNGKIYVVVAVIVIIVIGLFLYLYNLDKKISSLEKRNKS